MNDCKVLQLAQECEELENQFGDFLSYLAKNRYISVGLFSDIMDHMDDLRSVANKIICLVKDEEKQIIEITNLHESTANSGVDINI